MFNIFKSNNTTVVFTEPYRPSWEQTARDWEQCHIARKKAFESVKHDLSSNTLPKVQN